MSHPVRNATVGFHDGELAVQQRAGVARDASRLAAMLAPAQLRSGVTRFLSDRTFAVMTARDTDGILWTSPLAGPPGFLHVASPAVLKMRTMFLEGDPLRDLPEHQTVGLIVVEFATRRRLRMNGTLTRAGSDGLDIEVEQAYGNCPQYIQSRHLGPASAPRGEETIRHGSALAQDDIDLIRRSDTFFIGTTHPTRGKDTSHRGGPAGFTRVDNGRLWWPDYWGNNMFNTLGNLQKDPTAALLFCDFTTGRTLHLSGRADLEWTPPGVAGDDDRTGRRVHFTPEHLVAGRLLSLQADAATAAPDNPPLTA